MYVYTLEYNAFRMGGNPWQPVKTDIKEFEPLTLGGPCIVFHNPIKDLWHVAVVKCGAIVGTGNTKDGIIATVRADLASADLGVVAKQIEDGIKDCRRAPLVSNDKFFSLFKRSGRNAHQTKGST